MLVLHELILKELGSRLGISVPPMLDNVEEIQLVPLECTQ